MNRRVAVARWIHVAGLTLASALAHAATAQSVHPPTPSTTVGTWRGTSVCLVHPSACNDEIVVHRITPKKAADSVALDARKIVHGCGCAPSPSNRAPCARTHTWNVMRPLRYSINVTLDGCCDHRVMSATEDMHRHAVENLDRADAFLFGRVTYEMMESAWRDPGPTGARPDWVEPWMEPFARAIDAAKKYVVSSTLDRVDWNAELVRGDLGQAVQQLKREPGKGLFLGGVQLLLALAELGLIDEYEFVVQPRVAGHGPTLFAGLSKHVDLTLVRRKEFRSGAVAMRYEPTR
jgi:dihydrofolate reductase